LNSFHEYTEPIARLVEQQFPDGVENDDIVFTALGLAGEAGEVAEKVKKLWRNQGKTKGSQLTDEEVKGLESELGDCLWYVNATARRMGSSLQRVAANNLAKVADRTARGVVRSQGDNR